MLSEVRCERADLRRERVRLRIDHVQRAQRHLIVGEHAHHAPRGELVPRDEPRKRADAEARNDRFSDEEKNRSRSRAVGDPSSPCPSGS